MKKNKPLVVTDLDKYFLELSRDLKRIQKHINQYGESHYEKSRLKLTFVRMNDLANQLERRAEKR
jgi:hypothetical protein